VEIHEEARSMSDEWNTYRTRFLVQAKQLTEPLRFTDALGRQHCGEPGDYLVQSVEGIHRIAPREIFEDVYVRMEDPGQTEISSLTRHFVSQPSSSRHAET
jgi:hypothetical protein